MNRRMFNRLQPILNVRSVQAEREFYVRLGFEVSHESDGFVALSCGAPVLFGLQQGEQGDPASFERQMYWQFGVDSVGDLARRCEREGIPIESPPALQEWGEWVLTLRSPSGYRVTFEGPA
jgi:catechol 2,3-dioxygenase-like lactoylglutathione lyase family enzyme